MTMYNDSQIQQLSRLAQAIQEGPKDYVTLKNPIRYTQNLFGSVEDLRERLRVLEKNDEGDCLVIHPKNYLVSVDRRDVSMIFHL